MKKNAGKHLSILFLALVLLLAGWVGSTLGQDTEKEVRFIIPIEVEKFSEDKPFLVRLWTAEEFRISTEMTRKCPGKKRRCPEGVEYQEVTPEEFRIPVNEIAATIEARSKKIKVGDGYRLTIAGVSKNKRFTLVADIDDTARSETITLGNLSWKYLNRAAE